MKQAPAEIVTEIVMRQAVSPSCASLIVEGEKDGRSVRYVYELLDKYDPSTRIHSMARTTGYTATAAIRLLAAGKYGRPGVSPPEYLGRDPRCVELMLQGLEQRGVIFNRRIEDV